MKEKLTNNEKESTVLEDLIEQQNVPFFSLMQLVHYHDWNIV